MDGPYQCKISVLRNVISVLMFQNRKLLYLVCKLFAKMCKVLIYFSWLTILQQVQLLIKWVALSLWTWVEQLNKYELLSPQVIVGLQQYIAWAFIMKRQIKSQGGWK